MKKTKPKVVVVAEVEVVTRMQQQAVHGCRAFFDNCAR